MEIDPQAADRAALWRDERLRALHLCPTGELLFAEQAAQILDQNCLITWVKVRSLKVAIDLLRSEHYDVAVLDAWSFVDGGREAARELISLGPTVPLLVCVDLSPDVGDRSATDEEKTAGDSVVSDFFKIGVEDVLIRGQVEFGHLLHDLHAAAARRRRTDKSAQGNIGSLLASIPTPHLVIGQDGLPIFANLAAERLMRRSQQQLKAFPFDVVHQVGVNTEIDLILPGGVALLAAMDVSEITWEGELAFLVSLHDVTRWRHTAEKLSASEQKYRVVAENLVEPLILLTPDGALIYESASVEAVFGPAESRSQFFGASIDHVQNESLLAAMRDACASGEVQVVDFRLDDQQDERWFEASLRPVTGMDGGVDAVLAVAHDISARKNLQSRIDVLAERERLLAEHSDDLIVVFDESLHVVHAGPGTRERLEAAGSLTGEPFGFLAQADRQRASDAVRDCLAGRTPDPLTLRSGFDAPQWLRLRFSAHRDSGRQLVKVSMHDAQDLVRAESKAMLEQERFRRFARFAGDEVAEIDPALTIIWRVDARPDSGQGTLSAVPALPELLERAELRSLLQSACAAAIRTGNAESLIYHLETDAPLHRRSILFELMPLLDERGELATLGISVREITERQRRDEDLRDQETLFRSMLAASPDLLLVLDTQSGALVQRWTGQVNLAQASAGANPLTQALHPQDLAIWQAALTQAKRGTSATFAVRASGQDGATRWLEGQLIPITDSSGEVSRLMMTARDVTRFHMRHEELIRSNRFYESLLRAIPDHVYVLALDGGVQYLSPSATTSFSPSELEKIQSKGFGALLSATQQDRLKVMMQECLAGKVPIKAEYRLDLESREGLWFEARFSTLSDEHDEVRGLVVLERDASDQKRLEGQLQSSQSRLQQVIDASPLYVLIHDSQGRRIYQSPSYELLAGDESAHGSWEDVIIHPDDRERYAASFRALMAEPQRVQEIQEWRLVGGGGITAWVEGRSQSSLSPSGEVEAFVTLFYDVSERKLFELRLGSRESLYRALTEYSRDLVALIGAKADLVFENPALRNIRTSLRLDPDFTELIVSDDRDAVRSAFETVVQGGHGHTIEARLFSVEGVPRWYEIHMRSIDGSGVVSASVLAVLHDITHRKRIEMALLETDARHRALAVHSNEWVMLYDARGRLEYASPAALKGHGVEHEGLSGGLGADVHPEDFQQFRKMIDEADAMESGSATYRIRSQDDAYRYVQANAHRLRLGKSAGKLLIVAFDVTDRHDEQMMLARERFGSVLGLIISDVSSEFSDLIGIVIGNLDIVDELDAGGLKQRTHLSKAMQAAERTGRVNRALRALASAADHESVLLDLGESIAEMLPVLEIALGTAARLQFDPGRYDLQVVISRERLGAIVFSLFAQIRDELQGAAKAEPQLVKMSLQTHQLSDTQVGDLPAGGYACLSLEYWRPSETNAKTRQVGEAEINESARSKQVGFGVHFVTQLVQELSGAVQVIESDAGATNRLIWIPLAPVSQDADRTHDV